MECEICGQANASKKIEMDGSQLFTCLTCSSLGTQVKPQIQTNYSKSTFQRRPDFEETNFVEGYGKKIRIGREQKKLSINELALELKERESFLHKLEQEKAFPDKELTKKIEKFFGFKITE